MKKNINILTLVLLLSFGALAQGGGPGGGGPRAPINEKLALLSIAGLALAGWYLLKAQNKKI